MRLDPSNVMEENSKNIFELLKMQKHRPGLWLYSPADCLRQPGAYTGLDNLGATCYINSILQQFFMVSEFRKDILNATATAISDSPKENSACVLRELQKTFAYLQESHKSTYNPLSFTQAYKDINGESLDPHVQMDVDEFFNLLFDRLESALKNTQFENLLKAHFGGILAQQIKSNECLHLSEREESFFAIQCEVKDIDSLEKSLHAYVKGEVLDGDNKYHCSVCDKKVDAVKRMCIKQLPNHLLFNLKRFDFDFQSMRRLKINDFFSFPETINMKYYTDEYISKSLSDSTSMDIDESSNQIYELCGILVHSGTADSGHYYSFIRERGNENRQWFKFNDSTVSVYDPSSIPNDCFGGSPLSPVGRAKLQKHFSAYILVYDKIELKEAVIQSSTITSSLKENIDEDNKMFFEDRFVFHEYLNTLIFGHLTFSSIENPFKTMELNIETRRQSSRLAIMYFLNIFIRTKDLSSINIWIQSIQNHVRNDGILAQWTLDYLLEELYPLKDVLLQCPFEVVRESIIKIIHTSVTSASTIQTRKKYSVLLIQSCATYFNGIRAFWRTFNEFWILLASLSQLGVSERLELLKHDAFSFVADILMENESFLLEKCGNVKIGDRNGRARLEGVFALFISLLDFIDVQASVDAKASEASLVEDGGIVFALSDLQTMFHRDETHRDLILFYKIFERIHDISQIHSLLQKILPEVLYISDYGLDILQTGIYVHTSSAMASLEYCHALLVDASEKNVEFFEKLAMVIMKTILFSGIELEVVEEGFKFIMELCQKFYSIPKYLFTKLDIWMTRAIFHEHEKVRHSAKIIVEMCCFTLVPSSRNAIAIENRKIRIVDSDDSLNQDVHSEELTKFLEILFLSFSKEPFKKAIGLWADRKVNGCLWDSFLDLTREATVYDGQIDFLLAQGSNIIKIFNSIRNNDETRNSPTKKNILELFYRLAEARPRFVDKLVEVTEFIVDVGIEYVENCLVFLMYSFTEKDEESLNYRMELILVQYQILKLCCEKSKFSRTIMRSSEAFKWCIENIGFDERYREAGHLVLTVAHICGKSSQSFRCICVKRFHNRSENISSALIPSIMSTFMISPSDAELIITNKNLHLLLSELSKAIHEWNRPQIFLICSLIKNIMHYNASHITESLSKRVKFWMDQKTSHGPKFWQHLIDVIFGLMNSDFPPKLISTCCGILQDLSLEPMRLMYIANTIGQEMKQFASLEKVSPSDSYFILYGDHSKFKMTGMLSPNVSRPIISNMKQPKIHIVAEELRKLSETEIQNICDSYFDTFSQLLIHVASRIFDSDLELGLSIALCLCYESISLALRPQFGLLFYMILRMNKVSEELAELSLRILKKILKQNLSSNGLLLLFSLGVLIGKTTSGPGQKFIEDFLNTARATLTLEAPNINISMASKAISLAKASDQSESSKVLYGIILQMEHSNELTEMKSLLSRDFAKELKSIEWKIKDKVEIFLDESSENDNDDNDVIEIE